MRRSIAWCTWILWLASIALVTVRCGKDSDDKKSGGDEGGDEAGIVPEGWDGKSDWNGSSLEVIEE